tara:strand:- start:358 stop:1242 length:885 start_codon:yes stop_codon:yes gene_type:complete
MHIIKSWITLTSLLLIACSCSDDEEIISDSTTPTHPTIETIDLPKHLGIKNGEAKMFTMPTPLQMGTALNIMDVSYNGSLLLPHGNISASSDIYLSLALGMYLTDLGYTTVYSDLQESIRYAGDIQLVMDELPIAFYINDGFKNRFNENKENKDSLCKIILEGYNEANQHIIETKNEGLGLLVLTGAYIESLHLVFSSDFSDDYAEGFSKVVIQQILFLDNFIILLDGFKENPHILTILNNLNELKNVFSTFEIYFNGNSQSYNLKKTLTESDIPKIKERVDNLRDNVLSNLYN